MSTKFTNNASSKLTQALTADATSMHIQAEDVSKFPVLGAEDFCRLTIVGDHGDHEIVKVISISSDGTCTIERAQESTTAKEWPIENKVELRITAEYLNSIATSEDVLSLVSPIEEDISNINNNISSIETNVSNIENKHAADIEAVNTSIASVQKSVEDNVSQLEQNISDVNTSLTVSINSVNTSLTESINNTESTLTDSINSVKEEAEASYVKKIGDTLTGPLYGVTAPSEATKELVTAEWVQTNSPKTPISSAVDSESETIAASSKAVKIAYDKAVESLNKAGLPLGYFFTWPFSTPPDGSIIVNGSTYSRTLYADLWSYISSKSDWVKTESEWQSIASANNGYCPYYSDGDGSTTFRVPKFAPYQQIALSSASAGTYHEAGLPEIEAYSSDITSASGGGNTSFTGAFRKIGTYSSKAWAGDIAVARENEVEFKASYYNPIYGKSTTVQPESNEWIVCVVAYGKATNVGNVDVANVMSAVGTVQSNLTNYLLTAGGTLKGPLLFKLPGTEGHIGHILALNDKNGKRIVVDTYKEGDAGAYISLRKGSDTINPGGFEIKVRNSDSSVVKGIEARTDGNLLWDGKQIVRSVNGVGADANGDVNISVHKQKVLYTIGIINPSNRTGAWIAAPSGYTVNSNCWMHACMFQQRVDDDDKIICNFSPEGNGWRVQGYTNQRNGDGAVIYMIFYTGV